MTESKKPHEREKRFLRRYKDIKRERDQLKRQLDELESAMTAPKSQRLDGMPHNPSNGGNPLENMAIKHIELQERYDRLLGELDAKIHEIEDVIAALPHQERTLLRLHYIQGLKWEDVAERMSYSWRQTHRIHSRALDLLMGVPFRED